LPEQNLKSRLLIPSAKEEMPSWFGAVCADLPLAADPQLVENSPQGFATKNTALRQGFELRNSTTALGMRATLALEGIGKSDSARYYDPGSGRFVQEDPFRFNTGVDFFAYALNSPTRFNDPLGLSAQDVPRILACQKCTDKLTAAGERRPGSGKLNGFINNAISSLTLGYKYSGCTHQADLMYVCLSDPPTPYDDHWTFTVDSIHWGFHHVTVGRSPNPLDPIIVCDPWLNTSTTLPSSQPVL
jgi:hypothetical protein